MRKSPTHSASIAFPGLRPLHLLLSKYIAFTGTPASALSEEVDYNGTPYTLTSYVSTSSSPYYGWANSTSLADGSELGWIAYTSNAGNLVATITNPLSHVSTHTYAGINGQAEPQSATTRSPTVVLPITR